MSFGVVVRGSSKVGKRREARTTGDIFPNFRSVGPVRVSHFVTLHASFIFLFASLDQRVA